MLQTAMLYSANGLWIDRARFAALLLVCTLKDVYDAKSMKKINLKIILYCVLWLLGFSILWIDDFLKKYMGFNVDFYQYIDTIILISYHTLFLPILFFYKKHRQRNIMMIISIVFYFSLFIYMFLSAIFYYKILGP